jgi:GR25 family glycosyltransferase involved in LPS biosynthesis
MLQHLDALRHFITNYPTNPFCIICEDDILLSRTITETLPRIEKQFLTEELDILLLAYLTTIPPINPHFPPFNQPSLHQYPDDLWGSQCYMVSRKHARHLLETYTPEWAIKNPDKPYSPDWILTKFAPRRALAYPPLAIEDGQTPTSHEGQRAFHRASYELQRQWGDYM